MTQLELYQEQIDTLALHLEDAGITDVTLLEVPEELPDLEYGAGDRSLDVTVVCRKCDEEIDDHELMGTAYHSFYHDACVPDLSKGPLPLRQFHLPPLPRSGLLTATDRSRSGFRLELESSHKGGLILGPLTWPI